MFLRGRRSEKLFPRDMMTKRERVEATLNRQPVDGAANLEQLSHNSGVIALRNMSTICAPSQTTLTKE